MKFIITIQIILFLTFALFSQQFITGEISGLLKPGDYIISGTVYVLRNQKLQIAPGARLYFEQFSSLTVLGEIRCDGTQSEPVIFSSVKEYLSSKAEAPPDVFDWNGIEITADAPFVNFDFSEIRNCIFGLKIKSASTRIRLNNVTFSNIGYSSISKGGNLVEVKSDVPFSCLWNIDSSDVRIQTYTHKTIQQNNQPDSTSNVKQTLVKPDSRRHLPLKRKKLFLVGTGIFTVCSRATFITSSIRKRSVATIYTEQKNSYYARKYREKYNSCRTIQYTSGSVLPLGMIAGIITIIF